MKFLGKVPVGSDEESATELRVYEPQRGMAGMVERAAARIRRG